MHELLISEGVDFIDAPAIRERGKVIVEENIKL
jgi:hypothetical protein